MSPHWLHLFQLHATSVGMLLSATGAYQPASGTTTLGSASRVGHVQAPLLAPGVPYPQGLQGHDDENWPAQLAHDHDALAARYEALGALEPGIRRYNMFWSSFESVKSSATAMPCPAGTELHPSPSGNGDRKGFHRYHCYRTEQLMHFDLIFKMDEAIGSQGAGIFYSAPAWAIEPNCTVSHNRNGDVHTSLVGCVSAPPACAFLNPMNQLILAAGFRLWAGCHQRGLRTEGRLHGRLRGLH